MLAVMEVGGSLIDNLIAARKIPPPGGPGFEAAIRALRVFVTDNRTCKSFTELMSNPRRV